MQTPPTAETAIRRPRLAGILLGAVLVLAPAAASARAAPAGQDTREAAAVRALPQGRAVPVEECRIGRALIETAQAQTQALVTRSSDASPSIAAGTPRAVICRLALAAEISIRSNPGIF